MHSQLAYMLEILSIRILLLVFVNRVSQMKTRYFLTRGFCSGRCIRIGSIWSCDIRVDVARQNASSLNEMKPTSSVRRGRFYFVMFNSQAVMPWLRGVRLRASRCGRSCHVFRRCVRRYEHRSSHADLGAGWRAGRHCDIRRSMPKPNQRQGR